MTSSAAGIIDAGIIDAVIANSLPRNWLRHNFHTTQFLHDTVSAQISIAALIQSEDARQRADTYDAGVLTIGVRVHDFPAGEIHLPSFR